MLKETARNNGEHQRKREVKPHVYMGFKRVNWSSKQNSKLLVKLSSYKMNNQQ